MIASHGYKQQATSKKTIYLGNMSPGKNINGSGIKFFAVATSPASGSFDVVLQRQGAFGAYFTVGKATGYQSSNHCYDPRNNDYVDGQPFTCNWFTTESGNYRIILENATNPQATGFTRVEAWAY